MIIIKFREDKKQHKYGHYYIYERKSFRVDGKVKKKDIYIISIPQDDWDEQRYFTYRIWEREPNNIYEMRSMPLIEFDRGFPEELKEDFLKAVERYKLKMNLNDSCGG